MSNSGFLNEDTPFEDIKELGSKGKTSESFIVKMNGKNLFMKKLRAEFCNAPLYRTIFEKEYEVGKLLKSPYIPKYISIHNDGQEIYILMEYILGEDIEERLKNNPAWFRNEKNVQKLLMQLLEGLNEIHSKEIAHLDIKPKNIMLTKFGDNVKIIDLGFCANATYHHTAGYTYGFAAPEVEEKNLDNIDTRSDIYSIGLLLEYIKKLSGAKYSRQLNNFIQRCLEKNKELRFANAGEAIEALKSHKRWHVLIGAVVCAMVVLASIFSLSNRVDITASPTSIKRFGIEYRILSQEDLTCTVVGGEGFENNLYIEPKVEIGDNLYRTVAIEDSAFHKRNVFSVHIPEGIESVGKGAFYQCDSIVTLNLPSTIKDFSGAFVSMDNLSRLTIPAVKSISAQAFVDNISLEKIQIPEGVERICLDAFVSCSGVKKVKLPQTLKVMERGVFYNCTALEEITIPAGVTEIGDYAFFECDSLHSVYCYAPTPPRITAIFNTAKVKVFVPATALEAYKNDFNWGEYDIRAIE